METGFAKVTKVSGGVYLAFSMVLFATALFVMLVLPAMASAGKYHNLKIYKVEKHVDLEGYYPDNYATRQITCNQEPADIAVDGMWRIDHVDQANEQLDEFGDERDVTVTQSYNDLQRPGGDRSTWNFEMTNNADGRAQVKLFATCVGSRTAENSHRHDIKVTPRKVATTFSHLGSPNFTSPSNLTCDVGEIAVAPGFKRLWGGDVWLKSSASGGPTLRDSWLWNFTVSEPTGMEVGVLCLRTNTLPTWGHKHRLFSEYTPGWGSDEQTLLPGAWVFDAGYWSYRSPIQEKRVNCKDNFKAIVGSFYTNPWEHHEVHYLGMDPRPKQRAFKFWNSGATDKKVYLNTICLRDKSGKPIKP